MPRLRQAEVSAIHELYFTAENAEKAELYLLSAPSAVNPMRAGNGIRTRDPQLGRLML